MAWPHRGQPLERHRVPGAVAGQTGGQRPILRRHPHPAVPVNPECGRASMAGARFLQQPPAHEPPEHRAAERFGQGGDVVQRQGHEAAVRPEAAIGHQQMEMRVPVGERAVGLDRGDEADRELPLAGGGPDEGRERARHDPRGVPEQG